MPSGLPRVFQYSFTLKLAAQVGLRVLLNFRLPPSQVTNPLVPLLYVTLALSVFFKYHLVSRCDCFSFQMFVLISFYVPSLSSLTRTLSFEYDFVLNCNLSVTSLRAASRFQE